MSICKPKSTYDIHRDLCQKHIPGHTQYDLIGPFNKYREENYAAYKQKCNEFKAKGKEIKQQNIKALTNNKPKLGETYLLAEDKFHSEEVSEETDPQKNANKYFVQATISTDDTFTTSHTSVNTVRESGAALRKRHQRYYQTINHLSEHKCTFDPWFGRYLILSRFINAVRKVILSRRLLKRLKILKKLKLNPVMIEYYSKNELTVDHLIYPQIFGKYTSAEEENEPSLSGE